MLVSRWEKIDDARCCCDRHRFYIVNILTNWSIALLFPHLLSIFFKLSSDDRESDQPSGASAFFVFFVLLLDESVHKRK
jgi:hypothetical protein